MINDLRFTILVLVLCLLPLFAKADSISEKLSGNIVLQVEENGEAWYVNPANFKRYFLGRPDDAFSIMRNLGIGISNQDIEKFPIGSLTGGEDSDNDGLSDLLEDAIGADKYNADTDNDGYNDGEEVLNNYNPNGAGIINFESSFINKHLGKIFLQVEKNGEAWYINPKDEKRYYLGRPTDAFNVMKELGLGISNADLVGIIQNTENFDAEQELEPKIESEKLASEVIQLLGEAIIQNNKEEVLSYFTERMQKAINYSMDNLGAESKFILGNILLGSKYSNDEDGKKVFKNTMNFNENNISLNFYLVKDKNEWKLDNL